MKILEVGPRDGLQNEKKKLSVSSRYELIKKLKAAGLRHIEVGAFVSPKWVPQMKGSGELINKVLKSERKRIMHYSALVPNPRGLEDALRTNIKEIAVFGACSESFSKKNINCSIKESFLRFEKVVKEAQKRKIKVRGYLSTAFGCPYEGSVPQTRVVQLAEKMLRLGVYEVSIGDTIGVATPKQVKSFLEKAEKSIELKKIAMHFHDTRGTALANVLASLNRGIRSFDSSVGGLGGCPYAKGASGNLATEDLIYMLHGMGFKTGIDINKLIQIKKWLEPKLGRKLPSKVGEAGGW